MCKKSEFEELWNSIKYAFESKKGKYSLNTYLDIIGEFTDRLILESKEKEKLTYIGGECRVTPDNQTHDFCFSVNLFFCNENGEQVLKEASRKLKQNEFTTETVHEIGTGIKFEVCQPDGGMQQWDT